MIAGYHIYTITHKEADLKALPHFSIPLEGDELSVHLEKMKKELGLAELMYVPTCNRIMYFFYSDQRLSKSFDQSFYQAINPSLVDRADIIEKIKHFSGIDAIEHLLEVVSSIDSLVIGERQILRQVRDGYEQSSKWGLTGDHLRVAMRFAVESAKAVYAQTGIGEKPVSVVSLAVQQLLNAQLPKNARILMVGAGQTNILVSKFLQKHEYKNVTVFNRTLEKAEALANRVGGKALPWAGLEQYDEGFDCLIVCTGSHKTIATPEVYQAWLGEDTSRKVVIDLSVPHNVDPRIDDQFDIKFIEIEGLRALASINRAHRVKEVAKVRELLHQRLDEFVPIYHQRQLARSMRVVPDQIKAVKSHAIDHVFSKELESLDDQSKDLMLRMMNYMEKRCISIPMQAVKGELS